MSTPPPPGFTLEASDPRVASTHIHTCTSLSDEEFLARHVACTAEQARAIEAFPQRSTQWFDARFFRLTASGYASALGLNPYETPEAYIDSKLLGLFKGNHHTERGVRNEPIAMDAFVWTRIAGLDCTDIRVAERGLMVRPDIPFLGCSPDGEYFECHNGKKRRSAVEIKCPLSLKRDVGMYKAQVMAECFFLDVPDCFFVEYCEDTSRGEAATPRPEMSILEVPFDSDFWEWEITALHSFYTQKLAPALKRHLCGCFSPHSARLRAAWKL